MYHLQSYQFNMYECTTFQKPSLFFQKYFYNNNNGSWVNLHVRLVQEYRNVGCLCKKLYKSAMTGIAIFYNILVIKDVFNIFHDICYVPVFMTSCNNKIIFSSDFSFQPFSKVTFVICLTRFSSTSSRQ